MLKIHATSIRVILDNVSYLTMSNNYFFPGLIYLRVTMNAAG